MESRRRKAPRRRSRRALARVIEAALTRADLVVDRPRPTDETCHATRVPRGGRRCARSGDHRKLEPVAARGIRCRRQPAPDQVVEAARCGQRLRTPGQWVPRVAGARHAPGPPREPEADARDTAAGRLTPAPRRRGSIRHGARGCLGASHGQERGLQPLPIVGGSRGAIEATILASGAARTAALR